MRVLGIASIAGMIGLAIGPAVADMRVTIAGGSAILPAVFTPLDRHLVETTSPVPVPVPAPAPSAPTALSAPRALSAPMAPAASTPAAEPEAPAAAWTMPLMNRRVDATEKAADLPPDLVDAILRVESIYDPTRIDPLGDGMILEIRPGTASMNNVFADRWHFADTDANVHYHVHVIAQAWAKTGEEGCEAFFKNRASNGGPALTALSAGDCARMTRLREDKDEAWTRPTIAVAAAPLPVFAAPLPGARFSSEAFWAAQRARVAAIQARLKGKWRAATIASTSAKP